VMLGWVQVQWGQACCVRKLRKPVCQLLW
jgi:hypothetical protein